MDWDLILKAILILVISGSIATITFQLFKLLGEVRLLVKDSRKIVDDVSKVSNGVSNGYNSVVGFLNVANPGTGLGKRLMDMGIAAGASSLLKRYFNSKRSSEDEEEI